MAEKLHSAPIIDNKLFSVHVWPEQVDGANIEWRGRVTAQPGGEIAYFRTWDALIAYIQQQLINPIETE